MNYYTTTLSSINFSHLTHTTAIWSLENLQNVTLYDINVTTTQSTDGKPSSPYNLTQKIIIAIIFISFSLLTVIGNLMVSMIKCGNYSAVLCNFDFLLSNC